MPGGLICQGRLSAVSWDPVNDQRSVSIEVTEDWAIPDRSALRFDSSLEDAEPVAEIRRVVAADRAPFETGLAAP